MWILSWRQYDQEATHVHPQSPNLEAIWLQVTAGFPLFVPSVMFAGHLMIKPIGFIIKYYDRKEDKQYISTNSNLRYWPAKINSLKVAASLLRCFAAHITWFITPKMINTELKELL